jgi:hypothetical protein
VPRKVLHMNLKGILWVVKVILVKQVLATEYRKVLDKIVSSSTHQKQNPKLDRCICWHYVHTVSIHCVIYVQGT